MTVKHYRKNKSGQVKHPRITMPITMTKKPKKRKESRRQRYKRIGALGGQVGGAARAAALSPERRKEIARKAAQARWGTPTT